MSLSKAKARLNQLEKLLTRHLSKSQAPKPVPEHWAQKGPPTKMVKAREAANIRVPELETWRVLQAMRATMTAGRIK
jgi:hypothetical protein